MSPHQSHLRNHSALLSSIASQLAQVSADLLAQANEMAAFELKPVPVAPVPEPGLWEPRDSYAGLQELYEDLKLHQFSNCVIVNDRSIWDGFGPPIKYATAHDGWLRRT